MTEEKKTIGQKASDLGHSIAEKCRRMSDQVKDKLKSKPKDETATGKEAPAPKVADVSGKTAVGTKESGK